MTIDQQLDEIVSKLPTVNSLRNYWLIRTQGGRYYEDFVENNYFAIEPSNITLAVIRELEKKAAGNSEQLIYFIKDYIKKSFEQRNKKPIANRTAGLKTNQIYRFLHEIRGGDIVVIPSGNSEYVAIGEVLENRLAEFSEEELKKITCEYQLKRRVKWLKKIPRVKLDVNLYMAFLTHQTISDIKKYANVIERSVNDFYILYDNAHVILNIENHGNIPAKDLFGFGHLILEMLDGYATYANLDISSNDIEIQINLNSPGKVDLKSKIKKTTLVLGLLTFLGGGGYEDKEGHKFKTDGLPGIIKSVNEFLNQQEDRQFKELAFKKYIDSLHIKNPEDFNKLMKQFSSNKDIPK